MMRPRRDETQRRATARLRPGDGTEEATPMSAWLPLARWGAQLGAEAPHADDPGELRAGATPGHIVQCAPLVEEIYGHGEDAEVDAMWHHPAQRAMVLKPPGGTPTIRPHAYPTPHAPGAGAFGGARHAPCLAVPLYAAPGQYRPNASAAAREHMRKHRKNTAGAEDAWLYALAMAAGAPASHGNALEGMLPVSTDGWVIEDAIDAGKALCRAWYGNTGRGPARWMSTGPQGPIGDAAYDERSGTIVIGGARIGNVSHRVWQARCGQGRLIERWVRAQRTARRHWTSARAARMLRVVCRAHHIIEATREAIEVWRRAHESEKVRLEPDGSERWPV